MPTNSLAMVFVVLGSLFTVALASASPPDVVIFVPSGATRQPIARFDGERWLSACSASTDAAAAPMQRVRQVASGTAETKAVEPVVREIFARREREQRVAVPRLASATMTLDGLYASGPIETATYYFEASKRIEDTRTNVDPDTDPAGVLRVRVTGWLRASRGGLMPIASKADVEWEQVDRIETTSRLDLVPVGALRQDNALVWVMKRDAGAPPTYVLYETRGSAARVLLRSRC